MLVLFHAAHKEASILDQSDFVLRKGRKDDISAKGLCDTLRIPFRSLRVLFSRKERKEDAWIGKFLIQTL